MSTTYQEELDCPSCGEEVDVPAAASANVQRSPAFRAAVLAGTFHTATCPSCGAMVRIERDCLYSDLHRGVLIGCFSRARRGERALLERQMVETWIQTIEREAPAAVRREFNGPGPRVTFGLAELREKVVCFDAQLDDRLVEAVKLALLEGIAGREEAGVAGLMLVAVDPGNHLVFQPLDRSDMPVGEHLIEATMVMYDDMARTRDRIQALLPGLFEGLWVHHSLAHRPVPQPSAP